MTPELIIEQLTAEGIQLFIAESGRLKAAGRPKAISRWLPILKEHKPGIVAALRSVDAVPIQPGDRITWQRADGKRNDGLIDFLQPYPDEVWAFCTQSDGRWCAVNLKYVKREETAP